MMVAISRFAVRNGMEGDVRVAFENRPRSVDSVAGFLGLEVFQTGATFVLLTRWTDEATFRAWHASPSHATSHAFIPAGLKLDPSQTLLLVGDRIDGATSGAGAGNLTNDLFLLLARLLQDGRALHAAVVDGDGRVTQANAAFSASVGREAAGYDLDACLAPGSSEALATHLVGDLGAQLLLHLVPPGGQPRSLRFFVRRLPVGFALVGEPAWDDERAVEEQLVALTSELAVLVRENARQTRALEAANRELREAHWHLAKISEVLPMCMACRHVKTGAGTWEDAATFLTRQADFLSHGYCAHCAQKLTAELESS